MGEAPNGAAQRVLHLLTFTSGSTRTEIADALGLPNPTVITATARLVESGVVEEFERPQPVGGAGRRPRALRLAGVLPVLGVLTWNLHGLTASLVSVAGDTLAESNHAVAVRPRDLADLDPALDFLKTEAAVVVDGRSRRLTAIVIAVLSAPVPVRSDTVAGAPGGRAGRFGPWLRLADLEALMARAGVPVLVEKSANLAALAEHAEGAGVGHRDLFLVSFSRRGVNGGLILNGALYRGAVGFAGEIGHLQVDEPGALCGCGGRGCLVGRLGDPLLVPLHDVYGRVPPIDEVVDLAQAEEPGPISVLTELGRVVGRSVADVCTVLNPSIIIVGGSVGSPTPYVADGVRDQINRHCPPAVSHAVTVTTAALGRRAELLGALRLARTEL